MNISELRKEVEDLKDIEDIETKDVKVLLILSKVKEKNIIKLKLESMVFELGKLRAAIATNDIEKKNKAILKISQYKDVGKEIDQFEKEINMLEELNVENDLRAICNKQKTLLVAFGEIFEKILD